VSELPQQLKFLAARGGRGSTAAAAKARRVAVVDGAIGPPDRFASVAALFPHVAFESAGASWPERPSAGLDILIVTVAGHADAEVEAAVRRLKARTSGPKVVIVLRDADVTTTRRLSHGGAADVLPAPVSEPALALCLERLLTRETSKSDAARGAGDVVVVLKAGGGVGATALAVQTAAMLATRGIGDVCLADLDLQFGAAALYLDLPDSATVADVISAGGALEQTPFAHALPTHRSGLRVLAAPHDVTPLEAVSTSQADALIKGLRRDFALTVVDLPSIWTAWTNQVLHSAHRIVLVTHLSVPHIQLVKRQLRVLAAQGLDDRPLTLVCNALSSEQQASVSVKAAERAIEQPFQIVIPEDRRTMFAAINQGVQLSSVSRGTKLERAVGLLADKVAGELAVQTLERGRR
jgi:pilus assembly protein CpaE